jgi:hypothetical protein
LKSRHFLIYVVFFSIKAFNSSVMSSMIPTMP